MGKLINFMEKLGASAELQQLSECEVLQMLQQQNLTTSLDNQFHAEVERMLDARKNLVCGLAAAEEDDDVETAA